jgi:hypothetical protein
LSNKAAAKAALGLLADDRLDTHLTTEIAFESAPADLPKLLAADAPGLAPLIRYSGTSGRASV